MKDVKKYLGLDKKAARKLAVSENYEPMVLEEGSITTCEFRPNRLKLFYDKAGKIVSAHIG